MSLVLLTIVLHFLINQACSHAESLRKLFQHESTLSASDDSSLDIVFSNNYEGYSLTVNDEIWLDSADTIYRSDGKWVVPKLDHTQTYSGNDVFGNYNEMSLYWTDSESTNGTVDFVTSFRMYSEDPSLVLFTQSFPNGLSGTSIKDPNQVITGFPSFSISSPVNSSDINLGYVHWSGIFTGYSTQYGRWRNDDSSDSLDGTIDKTGPLCIINSDLSNGIVIAPLTNHMAASEYINKTSKKYYAGIIGNVTSIPSGFKQTWIITVSKYGGGVNMAMKEWGDKQLKYYNKERGNAHLRDYTLNYLGYSTDHGTFYYYYTEENKNYEETMIDVKKYVDSIGIPVKYVLLDSWWYYKGDNDGVKNWKPMPNIFPDGMEYVHNQTDWPIQAHNRYWSINNIYSKNPPSPYHNTGDELFGFTWGKDAGLPKTREFWDYLFRINDNWGLIVYEQDWLSTAEDDVPSLLSNITFGQDWLLDMGLAALDADLSIQYCMAFPRHVITSVQLESVTQTRASGDYTPGSSQWDIGITSILSSSIDLMPSKDSYWSSSGIQGNNGPYSNTSSEPYPRLQSVVLSLSNGPVTFGDGINYANKSLIMRSCNEGGLLLRPELPATMIENYFKYKSFGNNTNSFNGQIWVTNSIIGDNILNYQYFYLFVAILENDYDVTLNDLMFQFDIMMNDKIEKKYENSKLKRKELRDSVVNSKWVVYESNTTDKFVNFDKDTPLTVKACHKYDFQLYTFVPLSNMTSEGSGKDRWFLSGEIDKWISVSLQRFSNIEQDYDNGNIDVTIDGAVGEKVNIGFVNTKDLSSEVVECVIGENQRAVVTMPNKTCTQY